MSSHLRRAITALLGAAALGGFLSIATPAVSDGAPVLSKATARHQALLRVRGLARGSYWVAPPSRCVRRSSSRVACEFWAAVAVPPRVTESIFCMGDIVVTKYPNRLVIRRDRLSGGCGTT